MYKDSVIESQHTVIQSLSDKVEVKDNIIDELNNYTNTLEKTIKRKDNKIKWIKAGWIASIIVLEAVTLFILAN